MSATRPSTFMLKSGRVSVGAARLAVRQATRPKPIAAAAAATAKARGKLPLGDRTATANDAAAKAGPSHSAGSFGSSK